MLRFELDTSPRLTYPDRRVDAVQGTAAIERGPLVYCLEQADQPAGIDLADLALVPGQLEDTRATLPGVGDTILVRVSAVHRAAPQKAGLPYHAAADEAQASGVQAGGVQAGGVQAAPTRMASRSRPRLSPTSSGTTGTAVPCRSGPRGPPAPSPKPGRPTGPSIQPRRTLKPPSLT